MGTHIPTLYSAPWVLPITGTAIQDGAVVVRGGRIEAVGPVKVIRAAFCAREEIECRGVLMPALINAHIHLELSHLTAIRRPVKGRKMCDWIEDLIRARGECMLTLQEKEQCRRQILYDQHRSGVVLLADIGNEPHTAHPVHPDFPLVIYFREFLAPTRSATEETKAVLKSLPDSFSATAHAPYSTSPGLIGVLKKRTRRLNQVFSLHVAESNEEIEFLRSASGSFRDFLERRGAWDGTFAEGRNDLEGTVMYLLHLGVLDSKTLCVHCVHITEREIRILVEKGGHVCLCPGSNRFLQVGRAPVERMLQNGLLPAIGTDSIASNETLDLWREMQILREEHPAVKPGKILEMATLGGAAALQCENDFGSLSTRRKALFLEVDVEGLDKVVSGVELVDILTRRGRPQGVSWIGCGNAEDEEEELDGN